MPSRRTVVLALAISAAGLGAERAAASKIVYSCAPELCVVNPESGVSQKLTTDGATSAYRFPSLARNGLKVAAARGSDVMVGDYGANLTQRWAGSRDINDVALAPDGSGVAESHSYVENRYGCPLTGGCLELVDMSAGEYTRGGDEAQGFGRYRRRRRCRLPRRRRADHLRLRPARQLHHLCVVDTPGVPDAPCIVRVSSSAALFGPDGLGRRALHRLRRRRRAQRRRALRRRHRRDRPPARRRRLAVVLARRHPGRLRRADGWIYTVPTAGGAPRKLVQGVSPSWGEGDGPGPSVASTTLRRRKGKVPVKVACAGKRDLQRHAADQEGLDHARPPRLPRRRRPQRDRHRHAEQPRRADDRPLAQPQGDGRAQAPLGLRDHDEAHPAPLTGSDPLSRPTLKGSDPPD